MGRRVVATGYGGPEQLEVREHDPGEPGDGQVLVEVRAAGVNGSGSPSKVTAIPATRSPAQVIRIRPVPPRDHANSTSSTGLQRSRRGGDE